MAEDEILKVLNEIKSLTLLSYKDAYTVEDAALISGFSKSFIYKQVQSRSLPHFRSKGGKTIFINRNELNHWLMYHKVESKDNIEREAIKRTILA